MTYFPESGESAPMESVPTSPSLDQSTPASSAARARVFGYRMAMAILWTLVIMMLCWLPREAVHRLEDESGWFLVPNFDKVVHAGIFIVFAVLWARVMGAPRRLFWIAAGGFGLAVATEVGQLVPAVGRDASVADAVTDILGVVIGLAIAPFIEPFARSVESSIIRKTDTQPPLLDQPVAASKEVDPRTSR